MKCASKTEEGQKLSSQHKIDERLLEERKVMLFTQVDDASSKDIIRQMMYLESLDSKKPILFIINSPGGSIDSGFAIWDQIKLMKAPVYTLVMGLAASMGSILSLVAEKGHRYITKNARVMIHQPLISGYIQGQETDIAIQAKEIVKMREALVDIYVDKTGRSKKEIEMALDRDKWLSASEAKDFGLIDKIVNSLDDIAIV